MDLTALLQWLAENGITALVKTDAERMAEHGSTSRTTCRRRRTTKTSPTDRQGPPSGIR